MLQEPQPSCSSQAKKRSGTIDSYFIMTPAKRTCLPDIDTKIKDKLTPPTSDEVEKEKLINKSENKNCTEITYDIGNYVGLEVDDLTKKN